MRFLFLNQVGIYKVNFENEFDIFPIIFSFRVGENLFMQYHSIRGNLSCLYQYFIFIYFLNYFKLN